MSKSFQYATYGSKATANEVTKLLNHALETMLHPEFGKELPTPICIWGLHGIGKTELVRDLCHEMGYQWAYIAPAQFEEMGDLIGMPSIAETEDKGKVTRFIAPEWVPRAEGPGILMIDDVNRADDRILRGIMQLLQNYELVAWALPKKWLIVLTANPDGGDYSVTTMDDAMLTRMLHITMQFDAKSWAIWAEKTGIDPRGINFVLSYPELVNSRRSTPRSLVQFFQAIKPIENLSQRLDLVKMLGDSCLDLETVTAFISFIHLNLDKLPTPQEILEANQFDKMTERLERVIKSDGAMRMDILSVIVTRITNYSLMNTEQLTNEEVENLKNFILLEILPNDLRLSMAQELTLSKHPKLLKLYANPLIAKLLLTKM
jgi:AAA domain (dynein-related subfamily)